MHESVAELSPIVLYVVMNQVSGMHQFDSFEHLVGNHENGLERKTTTTFVKLIFKTWAQEVHHHEIVGILGAEVVDFRKAWGILKLSVYLIFMAKLRATGPVLLKLNRNL